MNYSYVNVCETKPSSFRNKRVIEAEAQAEAIQLKAEAQAFAIEAKAKAEAEQMAKKADAWNEYKVTISHQPQSLRADRTHLETWTQENKFNVTEPNPLDLMNQTERTPTWINLAIQDAAMVDMILKQLPKIAAEVAAPLQNVGKITLVAGPNGKIA